MSKKLRKIKTKKNKSLHTKKKITVKVLDSIEEYGYSIKDRDSELFKKEYEELKKILNEKEIDEKKYSEQVAKMFIIDLYTINSKVNKYDVGGRDYFYNTKVDMYDSKVMDTLYSNVQDDTYGDRKQELPIVKSIELKDTSEDSYVFIDNVIVDDVTGVKSCVEGYTISKNDNTKCVKEVDKVYVINLEWDYDKDMGYDNKGSVVVAKEDGKRWSVVEYKPKLDAFK